MVAITDREKARLFDLATGVLELVRDGKRGIVDVCDVLQVIKNHLDFASVLGRDQRPVFEPKIWRTIKLGLRKSPEEYRKALEAGKYQIGYVSQILDKTPVSQEEVEVDLVVVVLGVDLGFKNGAKLSDIFKRALELGLQKCPAEVGPALREQYPDQPMGEWFLIGMEPITDSDGGLDVFSVGRDGRGLWLGSGSGSPDGVWDPDVRWVFVLPRK